MACGKQYASSSLPLANDMARSWRAQDAILPDQQLLHPVRCTNARNKLHHLWVPVTPVTANNKETASRAFGDGQQDARNE
jgi:hypothetical protein